MYGSHQIYRCHEYQGAYGRIVIDIEKMKASLQETMYVLFSTVAEKAHLLPLRKLRMEDYSGTLK